MTDRPQTSEKAPERSWAAEMMRGAAKTSPVLFAIVAYGLVFGAQASQKGLGILEVSLMTGSNYAGGSEFAAIGLWASPPPLLLIVAVTILINSRHLIMGAALTPLIRHLAVWKALVVLFFMSDESWAIGSADATERAALPPQARFSLGFYAGCAGLIYLGWIVSTTLGAAVGPLLGDIDAYGFDMAFPAVFLVIVAGMWTGSAAARPWLVSLAVATATACLVPGASYVIAGTAAGLGTAYLQARPE